MRTESTLSQREAHAAVDAMRAELQRRQRAAVMAVADQRGELLLLERMDGVAPPSVLIAANKAWTAARLDTPTGALGEAAREQGWSFSFYDDNRYIGWDGGTPVHVGGQVTGAIAVSGLTQQEDAEIARIGAAAAEQAATEEQG